MEPALRLLEEQVLGLDRAERARLAEKLIASLDVDHEVEEAWAVEVERRRAEIENGTVTLLPGPETLAKLRSDLE